jgi:hypothetical protein
MDHKDPFHQPYLGTRETAALTLVHDFDHLFGNFLIFPVDRLNRQGLLAKEFIPQK